MVAAPRTTLLLTLTGTTALVAAWHPALAGCANTGSENYECSGTGQTIKLSAGADANVTVAAGSTANGDGSNSVFSYAGSGTLNVGAGAQLNGLGQSVASTAVDNQLMLQVNNAGTLQGDNTVHSWGKLKLNNASGGTISGTNTAITFNRLSQVVNDGTIQGAIQGNEGEVTNNGTVTGNIDLIYGMITNSGTINGAARGWANNIIANSGTITGEVRVDGNGAWDLGITNTGRMESAVTATGKGTLSNSGTIVGPVTTGGAVNLDNSGTIAGAVRMEVNVAGGSAHEQIITNRGTLQSTLYAKGDTTLDNRGTIVGAITLDSGGQYTVSNGGTINNGLQMSGSGTLNNSGTLAKGVYLDGYDQSYTATNSGTITDGVVSLGRLNLTNAATGTISGPTAITFNHLSQIINNGTIQGAILGNEGEVTNNGTITGNIDLIYGMITNSGTINGAARGWANNVIANSGTITGEVRVDGNGAWDLGITNTGRMESAVTATGKGTLSNSGTIVGPVTTGGAVNLDNSGTIAGAVRMEVNVAGGSAREQIITNRGTLQSTLYAKGNTTLDNRGTIAGAVTLDSSGQYTVTNSGTLNNGLIAGGTSDITNANAGVINGGVLASGYYALTNFGNVNGGLTMEGDGTIANYGTIAGPVNIVGRFNTTEMINAGTITGPVTLGAGDDVVTMGIAAVFGNVLDGGDGTDILRLRGQGRVNGTLVLSDGASARLRNFEQVEVWDAGTWRFSGTTDASLLMSGGTARGTATFANITANAGTLAPGWNGSGALTANGNVTLGPASVLLIEMDGASNGVLRATGNIALDGSLVMTALGPLRTGRYVLIDAGSLSGWFDSVVLPSGNWRQSLSQDGGQVVLTVALPALLPQNSGTGGNVVTVLEDLRASGTPSGGLLQVIDAVSLLPADQQARAVASMTPERQAGTPTVMANQMTYFQGAVQNRIAQVGGSPRGTGAAPIQLALAGSVLDRLDGLDGSVLHAGQSRWGESSGTGVWIAPWGGVARQKESGDATGWQSSSGGIAIGADTEVERDLLAGAALGWGRTQVSYGGVGGDSNNESAVASLYGAWTPAPWTVDASVTGALSRFDTDRTVLAGSETRIASSEYSGRTVAASLGAKRLFAADAWEISPDARLTAMRWWLDGYEETGAGAVNLQVDGRSGNRLRAETGVELARTFTTESGRLRPWLRLAAANDWTSGSRALHARLSGTTAAFEVDGKDDDGVRWLPGVGVSMDLSDSVEASLEYQGELRHDFQSHTGQMALRYKF